MKFFYIFLLFCIGLSSGCQKVSSLPEHGRALLVTNSTFESAAREFLNPEELFIARLSEPGTCPGHFDIQPNQARLISLCPLAVRFDFQSSLDSKINSMKNDSGKIKIIPNESGLCKPESYYNICRSMGEILLQEGWISQERLDSGLSALKERLASLEEQIRSQMQPLQGKAVLCSPHQELFCQWLGLQVAGTFSNSENFTVRELSTSFQQGNTAQVAFVIANQPEGERVANLLSQELQVPRVTFGNFPQIEGAHPFDHLLQTNIQKLLTAQ